MYICTVSLALGRMPNEKIQSEKTTERATEIATPAIFPHCTDYFQKHKGIRRIYAMHIYVAWYDIESISRTKQTKIKCLKQFKSEIGEQKLCVSNRSYFWSFVWFVCVTVYVFVVFFFICIRTVPNALPISRQLINQLYTLLILVASFNSLVFYLNVKAKIHTPYEQNQKLPTNPRK